MLNVQFGVGRLGNSQLECGEPARFKPLGLLLVLVEQLVPDAFSGQANKAGGLDTYELGRAKALSLLTVAPGHHFTQACSNSLQVFVVWNISALGKDVIFDVQIVESDTCLNLTLRSILQPRERNLADSLCVE